MGLDKLEDHMAIGLQRKCERDTTREAIPPIGSNCFSREARLGSAKYTRGL